MSDDQVAVSVDTEKLAEELTRALRDHLPKLGWVIATKGPGGEWDLDWNGLLYTDRREAFDEQNVARDAGYPEAIACSVIGRFDSDGVVPGPVTEDQVRAAALEVFKPEGVDLWYDAPNRVLHNATPAQYVRAGDGDKVLDLIEALASGAVQ